MQPVSKTLIQILLRKLLHDPMYHCV